MAKTVLLIDDDTSTTDLLEILLKPRGFNIHITNIGPEGVELTRELDPDIVIVDLLMPDMDGWQVCREIRKFSQVPIIILSVLNKPEMVAKALDLGADDYLIKPVRAKLLEARINTLTRRAEAEKSAYTTYQ